MADNLDITPGSGVAQTRTHDASGVHTQIVKLATGATSADETILDEGQQTKAGSLSVTIASDQADSATFQALADLASASISSSYAGVGSLATGTRIFSLVNTTSVWLIFSLSAGSASHIRVPPNSKVTYDLGTNWLKTSASVSVKYDTVSPGSGNGVASIEGIS